MAAEAGWGGAGRAVGHTTSAAWEQRRGQRACCTTKPQGAPCNPLYPPERPHFISFFSLPKQCCQLGTECPNTRAHEENFVFKLQLAGTLNSVRFSCIVISVAMINPSNAKGRPDLL